MTFSFLLSDQIDHSLQELLPDPANQDWLENYRICAFHLTEINPASFHDAEHQEMANWIIRSYVPEKRGVPVSSLDPIALKSVLGMITIQEPDESLTDFTYRLYGSRVAEVAGMDLTGKDSNTRKTAATPVIVPQYQAAARNRICVYAEFDKHYEHEPHVFWSRLIVPLLSESNQVTRVLVIAVPATKLPETGVPKAAQA